MRRQNFLNKLRKERRLELVAPSEEMMASYIKKAENSLRAAEILLKNRLYENSVINSYYAMYNSVLALFFKIGIKSENHTATSMIFKELFDDIELADMLIEAREERIDKQYYVESVNRISVTDKSSQEMMAKSEIFLIKIKLIIRRLKNKEIDELRNKFNGIFKSN